MKLVVVTLVTDLLIAGRLPLGFTISSTAPAFLWSPHQDGLPNRIIEAIKYRTLFPRDLAKSVMSEGGWSILLCSGDEAPQSREMQSLLLSRLPNRIIEAIKYRTLFPRDLAKSVMSEGGWSSLLCSGDEAPQSLDFALLFVGKELQSRNVSRLIKADSRLMDSLRVSFGNSNFSLAFPYVASSKENEVMESSLISQFVDTCGDGLKMGSIAVLESCSVEGETFEKLTDISAVQDYMVSKMEMEPRGQANLIVVCLGVSPSQSVSEVSLSEGEIFSHLMSSIQQLNAKYTVLYVSDPFRSIQYRSYRVLERFLAEDVLGNGSANSTVCDGVFQIKSSLLEGILVVSQLKFLTIGYSIYCISMSILSDYLLEFRIPLVS